VSELLDVEIVAQFCNAINRQDENRRRRQAAPTTIAAIIPTAGDIGVNRHGGFAVVYTRPSLKLTRESV
jgi:hypothetical protein